MTNWELLVAEISAPAILLNESDLVSHNIAAERFCVQRNSTPTELALKVRQHFPVSENATLSDEASWQFAKQYDGEHSICLRARLLQLNPVMLLVLADAAEDTLRHEELLACLDNLAVEFHIRDAGSGRFVYANRAELLLSDSKEAMNVIGKTPEQVYGKETAEMIASSDKKLFSQPKRTRVFVGRHAEIDYRASKQLVWPSSLSSPLIVRMAEDITEFAKARAERRQLMRDLSRAESIARVGSYRLDLQADRLHVSRFLSGMLALKETDTPLEFADILALFSREEAAKLRRAHNELIKGAETSSADLVFSKDSTSLDLELRCEVLRGPSGKVEAIFGALLDVSQRVQAELQVRFMAYHDMLTELPNRALFLKEASSFLQMAHRSKQKFALHLLDLDGFKEINDRLGHLAGDQVLQAVSDRIRSAIRTGDVAARLGGDEFAILHRNVNSDSDIERLGERLVTTIAEPIIIGATKLNISVSLGAAMFDGEDSIEQMVHRADETMYAVKRSGKGAFKIAG